MKLKYLTLIIPFIFVLFLTNQSYAELGDDTSSDVNNTSNKTLSQNIAGTGISAGIRFNLMEDVFIESEDRNNKFKDKDHVFAEIETFANQFFSKKIKQNFGGRVNFGYEMKGIRIYSSGGYVASTMKYKETGNNRQSLIKSAPFFGVGFGYDITKRTSIRLNSMFYNFDFKPRNSGFKNVEVNNAAITLGLAFHF